jgi:hypothetical protein
MYHEKSVDCNDRSLHSRRVYNKLFTKILDSSIWLESNPTRIVWITIIAAMDETGFVAMAATENLARRANVTLEEAIEAVKTLESADKRQPDQEFDGRRIERVEGGWMVLNSEKYRSMVTRSEALHLNRVRVARFRAKAKPACNGDVMYSNDLVMQSDHSRSESDQSSGTPTAPRKRNPLLDALAALDGADPLQTPDNRWSAINRVLTDIKSVCPDVTPDEIHRRNVNYRTQFPNAKCTAEALAKHWAICDRALGGAGKPKQTPEELAAQQERLAKAFGDPVL